MEWLLAGILVVQIVQTVLQVLAYRQARAGIDIDGDGIPDTGPFGYPMAKRLPDVAKHYAALDASKQVK